MNSPTDPRPNHANLPERVTRLEMTCEHMIEEMRGLRVDMREIRSDLRELQRNVNTDFRILFGALITVAIGLTGTMARAFGWI